MHWFNIEKPINKKHHMWLYFDCYKPEGNKDCICKNSKSYTTVIAEEAVQHLCAIIQQD